MVFTHDTEIALTTAVALVNTAPGTAPGRSGEGLGGVGDLDAFVEEWQYSGSRTRDDAELAAVRALRPQLQRLWTAEEEEQVAGVNDLLARARALPQLVRHDGWDWHLHATTSEAPLAERMAVEAAMALVDVLRAGERSRLRTCAADDCDDVLVDLSRNRSKRFCDGGCGNRVAVAAYRTRSAGRV